MDLTIISGGQTGVDRAALDAAIGSGLKCGGWCPHGRWAEDGPIPEHYPLRETASSDVRVRTERNVTDSDGTLVLTCGVPKDGTGFTKECALRHGKPVLEIDLESPIPSGELTAWIGRNGIATLNVAGPRESHRPGFVYKAAFAYLSAIFEDLRGSTKRYSACPT